MTALYVVDIRQSTTRNTNNISNITRDSLRLYFYCIVANVESNCKCRKSMASQWYKCCKYCRRGNLPHNSSNWLWYELERLHITPSFDGRGARMVTLVTIATLDGNVCPLVFLNFNIDTEINTQYSESARVLLRSLKSLMSEDFLWQLSQFPVETKLVTCCLTEGEL